MTRSFGPSTMTSTQGSPLLQALADHKVTASVVDLDHYRIQGGLAVETDYIILVESTCIGETSSGETFEPFRLSKTYSSFRSLSSQLKKNAEKACAALNGKEIPPDLAQAIKFTESLNHLVDSQKTEYFGKVSYDNVKVMAKQRSLVLNNALEMISSNYPVGLNETDSLKSMSDAIENFFLTDHCEEEEAPKTPAFTGNISTPKKYTTGKKHKKERTLGSAILGEIGGLFGKDDKEKKKEEVSLRTVSSPSVVPRSKKQRRSLVVRAADEEMLQASANLTIGDGGDAKSAPAPAASTPAVVAPNTSVVSDFFANNPSAVAVLVAVMLSVLRRAQFETITIDSDYAMLASFACFCFGLNWPRPKSAVVQKAVPATVAGRRRSPRRSVPAAGNAAGPARLLRASMMMSPTMADAAKSVRELDAADLLDEEEEQEAIRSPMDTYPEGAPLGEYFNCVSEPDCKDFHVRGGNYFHDKVKVPSAPFLFPTRGVDLFLTDDAPENVGSNSGCMGGRLRDVPSFVINFRLPWGVLVFYSEIPKKFLPFLHSCYDPFFKGTLPSLDDMAPGERTLARFLLGDDDHKNKTLKIVPVVVKGPWIVQSVAGGKPAIVGTKMPLQYIYGPKVGNQAEYLEADLDVVASAVARKICSVVASYTQGVTIDLGFVVEGQKEDELPEQMLLASRLHGIDPVSAPALPPMKDMFMINEGSNSD